MNNSSLIVRKIAHAYNRMRLRNKDFTLITNTCIGGIIYHELGIRFQSPTINCGIRSHGEFILFCRYLEHYMSKPLVFIPSSYHFPVGILSGEYGDVHIYFSHYHSEAEAKSKWDDRKQRVNWGNVHILMDGDNCPEEEVRDFNNLPQHRKAIITMQEYEGMKSVFAITRKDYKQGDILKYGLVKGSLRWFEVFDYVHFLNTGEVRKNALFRNR